MSDPDPRDPVPSSGDEEVAPSTRSPLPSEDLTSPRGALFTALGVTAVTAAGIAYAFDPRRAGQPSMLISLGALYAVLATFAVLRLRRQGDLRTALRPLGGDLSLGAASAGLLYGVAHIVEQSVAKHGAPQEAWLMRLYLQLGDPNAQGRMLLGVIVVAIAALEELTWRGLVMRSLHEVLGGGRAWILSSLLFALAHAPTMLLLGDPIAGRNPLVVLAALGGSLVWGALVLRSNRLVPSLFSHALFTWAIVEFPLWRP